MDKAMQRKLTTARRELRKAVERASKVDLLPGHYAEAIRLTTQIRDEADKLVKMAEEK